MKSIHYHTPTVAADQEDIVFEHSTSRPTPALQNRGVKNVPVVSFGIITLHQHHIKVGKTCQNKSGAETLHQEYPCP